jgi:hypothetical protein
MGETISKLLGNAEEETKDLFETLMKVAELKEELFKKELLATVNNPLELPIELMIKFNKELRVNVGSDAAKVKEEIKKCVNQFSNDKCAEGITTIAESAITFLVGESSKGHTEKREYGLFVTKNGGIARIDILVYKFESSSQKFISTHGKVGLFLYAISAANVEKLTENSLTVLIDNSFPDISKDGFEALSDEVKRHHKKLRET